MVSYDAAAIQFWPQRFDLLGLLEFWHRFRCRTGEDNFVSAFANQTDAARGIESKSGGFGADNSAFPRNETIVFDGERLAIADTDTTNFDTPRPMSVDWLRDHLTMPLSQHYELQVNSSAHKGILVGIVRGVPGTSCLLTDQKL